MDNKELLISTITNVNAEASYISNMVGSGKDELNKRAYLILRIQITEDINLEGSFTLENYLFENELIKDIIVREIIRMNNHLKIVKKINKKAKFNKDYQEFLNNLPDEIKLRVELEK